MGKLFQLEIENFKSYSGKQIIGPFFDFTCIIGPNGAGKSNLMDAISFVLGVQSRFLRSTQLKELIYRKNASADPSRRAVVQLTYQVSANEIPNFNEGEFIHFSRLINASGTSTYRYNEKDVTYEQYEDILQSIGVLVKVRNFLVFQGDVESIASKSPMELTKLLEHICGSDIYATEYESLQKKKMDAEDAAIFAISKKKMFLSQSKEVKIQKDEADFFQQKQHELQQMKSNQILWNLYHYQATIITHQSSIQNYQQEMQTIDQELNDINLSLNKLKIESATANTAYNKMDKTITNQKAEKEKLESKLLPLRNKIAMLKKRIQDGEVSEKKIQHKIQQKDTLLQTLRQNVEKAELDLQQIKEQMKKGSLPQLQLTEQQLQTYSSLKEQAVAKSSAQKTQLSSLEIEYKSTQQQFTFLQNQYEGLNKEINMIHTTLQDYTTRREQLMNNVRSYDEELHKVNYDVNTLQQSIEYAQEKTNELHHQLKGIDESLSALGDQRRKTKQEQQINASIEAMQSLFKGVYGKLSDLCRPIQQKYSKAITVAGGKLMDAIVVENKVVAQECIRYMKENRIGIFTFLPLDTIQVPTFPDRLRRIDPTHFHPCIDLIDVSEERFRPAVLYAFETTLIADNLDYARNLCFEKGETVKVVTLKGQVISRSGAMTGGSISKQVGDRWGEKEYENLKTKKAQIQQELQSLETTLDKRHYFLDLQERKRQNEARKDFCSKEIKVLDDRIKGMQSQSIEKQSQAEGLLKQIEDFQKEITQISTAIEKLNTTIVEVEKDIFGDFSRSIGIENILIYEQQIEKQNQYLYDELNKLSKIYSSLKAQYDYEQRQDLQQELLQLQSETQQQIKQLEKMKEEEMTIQQQLTSLQEKLDQNYEQYLQYTQQKNMITDRLVQQKKQFQESSLVRDGLIKKITSDELIIERNMAELLNLIKQTVQFDEIQLPIESELSEEEEEEDRAWILDFAALSQTEPSLPSQLDQKYLNLKAFRDQYSEIDDSKIAAVEKELKQKIASTITELENMKPNLHAAEKYDDVMAKVRESNDELEECKNTVNALASKYEEIRKERLQLFTDCYEHINETLSDIYRDLTKSSKHPLGGKAYFTLESNEEPFLSGIRYTAMPPMKRFRDMEQLSGGEKTMAALALLFSIHSYRQAPFFVLDEVDAALDNVNVKKICSYIKQRSQDFQCIVISLKDIFFEHADSLIGVYRDDDSAGSKILTLSLKEYPETIGEDDDEDDDDDEEEEEYEEEGGEEEQVGGKTHK